MFDALDLYQTKTHSLIEIDVLLFLNLTSDIQQKIKTNTAPNKNEKFSNSKNKKSKYNKNLLENTKYYNNSGDRM